MKLKTSKKGVELSLQTIVILIILLVALIVIIYFFTTKYTDNSGTLLKIGEGAINQSRGS